LVVLALLRVAVFLAGARRLAAVVRRLLVFFLTTRLLREVLEFLRVALVFLGL
jgi:hypothetical protein